MCRWHLAFSHKFQETQCGIKSCEQKIINIATDRFLPSPSSVTALNSLCLLEPISHCFSLYFWSGKCCSKWTFMFRHSLSLLLYNLSVFWFSGRKQAKLTGQRLQELGLPYTRLVRSTMTRANETAQIILTSLPNIPVTDCCLLEEGAPIPPEPPVGSWKPEPYVRLTYCFMLSDLCTI